MQRTICGALLAGAAFGANVKHQHHSEFLSVAEVKDEADAGFPSAAEYRAKCSAINNDYNSAAGALLGNYNDNLAALKAECEKQTRILAGDEQDHSEETDEAKASKMEVSEARLVVKEYDQCRPELEDAKAKLAEEEAIPNEVPQDVDRECELRKLVIKKEACVARLRKAEAVLAKDEADHKDEVKEREDAARKVPPQAERKRKACQAYEDAKNKGAPNTCGGLNDRFQSKRDALVSEADQAVEDALAEYTSAKTRMDEKKRSHSEEVDEVREEQTQVNQAQDYADSKAHCPPELVEAEAELRRQEAIPNDSPADIDAECEARKAVLKAKPCAAEYKKAVLVLKKEKADLAEETAEENSAESKVPPAERKAAKAKATLEAARAARKALPCNNPCDTDAKPEPKEEKPEAKSGAVRAATLAVVAVLCAAVHMQTA